MGNQVDTNKTDDSVQGVLSSNPVAIPTVAIANRPQPSLAYMLEVSLDVSGGLFIFKYTGLWKKRLDAATGPAKHAQFLAWVAGEVQQPTPATSFDSFDATANNRKPSKMSFNCKELIYLVIKLAPGINWRFTADAPPISMDKIWQNRDVFFNASNLDERGIPTAPAKNNAFKYACVIVDCPKGVPGGPIPTGIEARFNLHVDLMEGLKNDAPYVPIIIDPDVRNPGGGGG